MVKPKPTKEQKRERSRANAAKRGQANAAKQGREITVTQHKPKESLKPRQINALGALERKGQINETQRLHGEAYGLICAESERALLPAANDMGGIGIPSRKLSLWRLRAIESKRRIDRAIRKPFGPTYGNEMVKIAEDVCLRNQSPVVIAGEQRAARQVVGQLITALEIVAAYMRDMAESDHTPENRASINDNGELQDGALSA